MSPTEVFLYTYGFIFETARIAGFLLLGTLLILYVLKNKTSILKNLKGESNTHKLTDRERMLAAMSYAQLGEVLTEGELKERLSVAIKNHDTKKEEIIRAILS